MNPTHKKNSSSTGTATSNPPVSETVPAKFSRPRVTGVYARERLFRKLDELLPRCAVYLVAQAGAGKTTLMASYVEARRLPCLWYQVSAEDADIAGFFHFLSQAVRSVFPEAEELPRFSLEFLPNLSAFSRRYFRALFQRISGPFLIVLDDAHAAGQDTLWHGVLRDALAELPEDVGLLLASRNPPPPVLARSRLHQELVLLDWDALRLTEEEAFALARQRAGEAAPEWVRGLYVRSEGWVAGLLLLLEWAQQTRHPAPEALPQVRELVFDYFAAELFAGSEPAVQDFLLQTALLPSLTEAMAVQLTGYSEASHILAELHRNHYFTERRGGPPMVYRYHALFREFLLDQGRERFAPVRLRELSHRAAGLLAGNGQPEAALELFRGMESWPELIPLLLREAPVLAAAGRLQTLEHWLVSLPPAWFGEVPWLGYWLGVCHMAFAPAEARVHFEQALPRFRAEDDAAGSYLAWSGILAAIVWEMDEPFSMIPWLPVLDELQEQFPEFPSPEIEAETASRLMSISLWNPGEDRIRQWRDRAEALLAHPEISPNSRVFLGATLVFHHLWRGDYTRAEVCLNLFKSSLNHAQVSPWSRISGGWMKAQYHQMLGEHEHCFARIEEGLAEVAELGIAGAGFQFHTQGAIGAMKAGRLASARGFLERMQASLVPGRSVDLLTLHYQSAGVALCGGEFERAEVHIQEVLSLSKRAGNFRSISDLPIWLAHIAAARGDPARAARELAEGRELARRHLDSPLVDFEYGLAEADLALQGNDQERGISLLRQSLAEGRRRGFVSWPFCLPPLVLPLLRKALEEGIEVEYVQSVIRRHCWAPEPPPVAIEHWPWPIRIYTLGRFSLVWNGETLKLEGKPQRKPLELLWVLIAQGGREVSQQSLMDVLWPETDGDAAYRSLITNLQRLRQLLGCPEALILHDGRLTLDTRQVWVDAWAFERGLGEVKQIRREGRSVEADRRADRFLWLYQAPFLAHLEVPCVTSCRGRLRTSYREQLLNLARSLERTGRNEEAIDWYRRGLRAEETCECFYLELIELYLRLGRSREAREALDQALRIQHEVLQRPPSRALLVLRQRLEREIP